MKLIIIIFMRMFLFFYFFKVWVKFFIFYWLFFYFFIFLFYESFGEDNVISFFFVYLLFGFLCLYFFMPVKNYHEVSSNTFSFFNSMNIYADLIDDIMDFPFCDVSEEFTSDDDEYEDVSDEGWKLFTIIYFFVIYINSFIFSK